MNSHILQELVLPVYPVVPQSQIARRWMLLLILMSTLGLGQLRLHGDVVWLKTKPVSGGAADPASLPCWESNCVPKKVKSILYNILDQ